MQKRKIRGISLLELMLSLAIIAILLVMATRYFSSVRSEQQVDETVKMVQQVTGAADNWLATYKSFQKGSVNGISMPDLINQGLVPNSFNTSPWNAPFAIQAQSPDQTMIVIYGITTVADCANLQAIFCNKQNLQADCLPNEKRLNLYYPSTCTSNPAKIAQP